MDVPLHHNQISATHMSQLPVHLRQTASGSRLIALSEDEAERQADEFMILGYSSAQVEVWLIMSGFLANGLTAERIFLHFTPPAKKPKARLI